MDVVSGKSLTASFLKLFIFFFASSIFGLTAALLIHEFGHALAVYFLTGHFPAIHIDPLSGGSVRSPGETVAVYGKIIIAGGGIVSGIVTGMLLTLLLLQYGRKVWAGPFLLAGVISAVISSLMLLVGVLFGEGRDVSRLISLGISKPGLFLFGTGALVVSAFLFLRGLSFLGIGKSMPLWEKTTVIFGSFFLYAAVYFLYAVFIPGAHPSHFRGSFPFVAGFLLFGSIAAHYGQRAFGGADIPSPAVTWVQVLYSLGLALIFILTLHTFM